MPVEAYSGQISNFNILRVYALRLSYEYCKQLDRDKSISANLASHCIIIRQKSVLNKTDFGYKQQLKTGVLKKMHFVYLQKIQDLFAFLYKHIKHLQQHTVPQSSQIKNYMKSEPTTKGTPLFGMLLIQNIETYFGNNINYQSMGTKLFLFVKLMKVLQNLMPFNSNLCFTYNYNPQVCNYVHLMTFLKSQNITFWRVGAQTLQKNGYSYESQWTRKFYSIYQIQQAQNQEEEGNNRLNNN